MRWKLPQIRYSLLARLLFAYMAVTLVSWIFSSTMLGLCEYKVLRDEFKPETITSRNLEKSVEAAEYLESSPPNFQALKLWLVTFENETLEQRRRIAPDIYSNYESLNAKRDFLAVFDAEGKMLAANEEANTGTDFRSSDLFSPSEKQLLENIRGGENEFSGFNEADSVGNAVPVKNAGGKTVGVFFTRSNLPLTWGQAVYKLTWNWFNLFSTMIVMFACTGLVFSFFLGRHLTRRLKRISDAANAWSIGDFKTRAFDNSDDEIGLLARRLNAMAKDLNEFFLLKQHLAAATERNKLARDLHDSVKQQVFALSMQIGAANLLADQSKGNKNKVAKAHLAEAEKLAQSVQRELVDLINELRPPDQKNESLVTRLENFAADWKRQNKIAVQISAESLPPLAPHTEHTLFRIVQEALANTARHSGARRVSIEIKNFGVDKIELLIADDGNGFDRLGVIKGLGLINMRERAELLPEGTFRIDSQAGNGTEITVSCAIHQKTSDGKREENNER